MEGKRKGEKKERMKEGKRESFWEEKRKEKKRIIIEGGKK